MGGEIPEGFETGFLEALENRISWSPGLRNLDEDGFQAQIFEGSVCPLHYLLLETVHIDLNVIRKF